MPSPGRFDWTCPTTSRTGPFVTFKGFIVPATFPVATYESL
jgi:hypothetical protein